MNVIDAIRFEALEFCMKSGMRYNDALYYVLNTQSYIDRVEFKYIKSFDDAVTASKFAIAFELEYAEYVTKMKAAGML